MTIENHKYYGTQGRGDIPHVDLAAFAHYKPAIGAFTPHKEIVDSLAGRRRFLPSTARSGPADNGERTDRGVCWEQVGDLRVGRSAGKAALGR